MESDGMRRVLGGLPPPPLAQREHLVADVVVLKTLSRGHVVGYHVVHPEAAR
jgi:hypothetical protein